MIPGEQNGVRQGRPFVSGSHAEDAMGAACLHGVDLSNPPANAHQAPKERPCKPSQMEQWP